MTTATKTKYEPRDVPASGSDRSRFMLPSGPGGVNNPPAVTALTCYSTLLQERRAESNTVDTSRLISWKKVVQVEDQHVLIHGGEIRVVPASEQRSVTRRSGASLPRSAELSWTRS